MLTNTLQGIFGFLRVSIKGASGYRVFRYESWKCKEIYGFLVKQKKQTRRTIFNNPEYDKYLSDADESS